MLAVMRLTASHASFYPFSWGALLVYLTFLLSLPVYSPFFEPCVYIALKHDDVLAEPQSPTHSHEEAPWTNQSQDQKCSIKQIVERM